MGEGPEFLSLGIAFDFLVAKVAKVADFTGGCRAEVGTKSSKGCRLYVSVAL